MKRRIIAASVAILVALASGVLLLGYVRSADTRAMAGMRTEKVLVVVAPIPKGTAGDALGKSVALRELPATAVVSGALASTSGLKGKLSTSDLQVGEQLLSSRFAAPVAAKAEITSVPKGFSEVSVLLDPDRAVGSNLSPGYRVGVFISLGDDVSKGTTHLALNQVLVTRVQGTTAKQAAQTSDSNSGKGGGGSAPVPDGSLMVTLAVSANDAEQVVFAAEYGHIWLSLENKNSTNSNTRIVTEKNDQQ